MKNELFSLLYTFIFTFHIGDLELIINGILKVNSSFHTGESEQ